jgi:PAS domain S-box-containing protein
MGGEQIAASGSMMRDRFGAAALEAYAASTQDPLWIVDGSERLVYGNSAFLDTCGRLFHARPEPGQTIDEFITTRRRVLIRYWRDLMRRALSGRVVNAEGTYRVDGVRRRFSVCVAPVQNDGRVDGALFTVRDITDYRRGRSHEFLELALARIFAEEAPADPIPRLLEAFCESIGWDLGVSWGFRGGQLHPEAVWHKSQVDAHAVLADLKQTTFAMGSGVPGRVWRSGEPLAISDIRDETGAHRSVHARASGLHAVVAFPILDSGGTVQHVLEFFARRARTVDSALLESLRHVGREIGRYIERKAADAERVALQELLVKKGREWSLTFDAIDAPIFIVDASGIITRLNRAARDIAAAHRYQDLLGRNIADLGVGEPWPTLARLTAAARALGKADAQVFDGHRHWHVSVTIAPAGVGDELRIVAVMRDVTTILDLQASLRRSERLSAMGELVAGVAHEVRNPLFGMSVTLDAWEMFKDDASQNAELIPVLRKWLERLNTLMERLLDYGRSSEGLIAAGPIDEVITAAIDSCQPLAQQERITIVRELPEVVPRVPMDSSRLVQAFENLILNAIQHSPAGGEVRIRVRPCTSTVECAVTDSGPGFAPEDLAKVFEPFFTRRRGGTGLGLSIVSRIVEELGGTITAANAATGGAQVTMVLPCEF